MNLLIPAREAMQRCFGSNIGCGKMDVLSSCVSNLRQKLTQIQANSGNSPSGPDAAQTPYGPWVFPSRNHDDIPKKRAIRVRFFLVGRKANNSRP
jgi:hypothetical protein